MVSVVIKINLQDAILPKLLGEFYQKILEKFFSIALYSQNSSKNSKN